MRTGSTLVRRDGKQFKVVLLSHWSDIRAEDGEEDSVKWYGMSNGKEAFVSASKGFSYELQPEVAEAAEQTEESIQIVSRVENHRDKFYEVLAAFRSPEKADKFVADMQAADKATAAARGYPNATLYYYSIDPIELK